MIKNKLGNFVNIKTGKLDANASSLHGEYPFFTCSKEPLKIETYSYDCKCVLIAGNGDLNVKYYEGKFDAYQRTYIIESKNESILNTRYLYWFLFKYVEKLRELSIGGVIKYIKINNLTDPIIPIPSIEDQKRIVKILDTADMLLKKRKQTISLLDEYLKSLFLDMFGDPVKNTKEWETKTIEQIVKKDRYSIKRGPFGGALKKEIFVDSGYLVYEQFHALNNDFTMGRYYIDEKKFQELKAFEVKSGDIIISCSGVYLGKLAIVPENSKKGIINQALLKISLDNTKMTNLLFISIFTNNNFKNKFFGNKIGSGIPNFPPISEFKKFVFICPPIDLQNKYSKVVEKTTILKNIMLIQYEELDNQFKSLMKKALKGEL